MSGDASPDEVLQDPPAHLVLADTIGVAVPSQVRSLVAGLVSNGVPVGVHLHNTRNTGYANALTAVEAGATIIDTSVGGAGGCPFVPNATGNIATEDLVYMLEGMGVDTGIDLDRMIDTSHWLAGQLGSSLPGMVAKVGRFPVGVVG